ncbi:MULTISPECIES: peptidylprolyl isomerase [unclassified Sphingomonas]|uniref:peptidylprolyl isomerase n=1 Tax=unclassified Sphingomonas TaxID=196159 RepID=UPI0006F2BE8A|nr:MULTISPECIES: peptidylprolyl isomerase [unclassified Sphingomonas]KQX22662.1 peptidylprolyl isomerase [Sphingomonas sp. Root1294]KQY67859.1 peptidylprolyl isomerase [Sphingomonas sp. Root50]KRB88782.1 peptidylprolyl isomerase [Sphingomonas sp. Root720]
MIRRLLPIALALLAVVPAAAPAIAAPAPATVKVALKTSEGTIVVAVDTKRAPITAGNFLAYVDQKKLDGTTFYRAARAIGNPKRGFIQGGVHRDARRSLPPIKHEPTTKTGIRHVDGTISMARREPGSAMGEFFILAGDAPAMDARPGGGDANAGYAAFGRLVSGKPVLQRILAAKTWPGGSGSMKGQLIRQPVKIIEAKRVG